MTYYRSSSQRRVKKYLKKNGFSIEEGSKHIKAYREGSETTIIFPISNTISSGVMKDICKKLESLGIPKVDIESGMF
jgi:predicted RNA binding protein YcfA (HicA-like mRNA interferase family)